MIEFLGVNWLWFLVAALVCFAIGAGQQLLNIRAVARGKVDAVFAGFGVVVLFWFAGIGCGIFFLIGIISAFIAQAAHP